MVSSCGAATHPPVELDVAIVVRNRGNLSTGWHPMPKEFVGVVANAGHAPHVVVEEAIIGVVPLLEVQGRGWVGRLCTRLRTAPLSTRGSPSR